MDLKERLQADLKTAMKEKDTLKKNVVTMLRAGILQVEKDEKVTLDDSGVTDIAAKQLKQRRDSLAEFEKAGRGDLISQTNGEIEILLAYLPAQLTENELESMISEAITRLGVTNMKDFKALMADLSPKIKGRADSKNVGDIARSLIGK